MDDPISNSSKVSMTSRNDLSSKVTPKRTGHEKIPNLIVTYSKIGLHHNNGEPTPPSCGGVQSGISLEDPLTPPPSYDSAVSTPEKHFSLYSIPASATHSIT